MTSHLSLTSVGYRAGPARGQTALDAPTRPGASLPASLLCTFPECPLRSWLLWGTLPETVNHQHGPSLPAQPTPSPSALLARLPWGSCPVHGGAGLPPAEEETSWLGLGCGQGCGLGLGKAGLPGLSLHGSIWPGGPPSCRPPQSHLRLAGKGTEGLRVPRLRTPTSLSPNSDLEPLGRVLMVPQTC